MAPRIVHSSCFSLLGLSLLTLGACANPAVHRAEQATVSQPPTEAAAARSQASAEELSEPPLVLARDLHDSPMSEVVLDPRARAALTLDTEGKVRLWTDLSAGGTRAPLVIPEYEPGWMSLARTEGGFVAGFIDTAGGGRVIEIAVDGTGARMSTLFEIPATDPLFEMHVLDGGERILVLGIDHRVRLYDRQGTALSVLEPMGFVPWQLRVQQPEGGAVAIVAVLAGPTRVQAITLQGDRLALRGEPRTVEIDQGPNRNDLSLMPDGRRVVAMRRPKLRGKRFTFEVIELQTDARSLIAAKVDTTDRPRVLPAGGDRVLLESGSGRGFWLELSAAVPWTGPTGREETQDVPATAMTPVRLAGSTTARRMHVTLRAGVRAVPTSDALVVDPIDEGRHVQLGAEPLRPQAVALSPSGSRVAWSSGRSIVFDRGEPGGELHRVPSPTERVVELAFIGDERLLVLGDKGHVKIIDDEQGQVVSSIKPSLAWGLAGAGFRRGASVDEGTLALMPAQPRDPILVVDVGDGGFGERREVPRRTRTQWPALGVRARDARGVIEALGFEDLAPGSIAALVDDGEGAHLIADSSSLPTLYRVGEDRRQELPLREGRVERLVPERNGSRVAVLQRVHVANVFGDSGRMAGFDRYVVSVYDLETEQRLWSRPTMGVTDLEWSHDGERLAVAAYDGGRVIDASTGEQVILRRHLGLRVTEAGGPGPAQ